MKLLSLCFAVTLAVACNDASETDDPIDDPADAGELGDPGPDYEIDGECTVACNLVASCGDVDKASCQDLCRRSELVDNNGPIHCMALRIFWMDEEGCSTITAIYENFEAADDCSD